MKLRIIYLMAVVLAATSGLAQPIFTNPITGINPNTDNPFITGQTVAPNLTVSGIGRGSGILGTNANDRYNANNWDSAAFDPTAYFEFIITPSAGYQVLYSAFNFTWQRSSTGPQNFAIRTSLDNFTNNISTSTNNTTIVTSSSIDFTAPAFQNVTAPITFRVYAWGASAAAGTFSINDFEFLGSVISGSCGISATFTPMSGPPGTIVTATATTGNFNGAVARVDGITVPVNQVDATQVQFAVPAGVTFGQIIISNASTCTATASFTPVKSVAATCQGAGSASDLFISEFADSTYGTLAYLEIYNGTGAAVNLSNYSLRTANNGLAYSTLAVLSNVMLANGATYVVAYTPTGSPCSIPGGDGSYADQTLSSGGINFNVNGNDHIGLFKNGNLIDSFGVFGSSSWADNLGIDGNGGVTFIRKISANSPSVVFNNNDWNITDFIGTGAGSCANNDYSDIRYHIVPGNLPNITGQPLFTPSCNSTSISLTVSASEGFTGGNLLAYQWYVNAPGWPSWTAVSNTGVYSGATTSTLNISNISALNGFQYYVQVRENTATCYTASNATIITVSTPVWNGTSWTPSAPTATSGVTINGNYDTGTAGSFDACSVVVNGGATLTINAGDYVSIQNNLTVNATGALVVHNDASLVMISNTGSVTNNGTIQVLRTTTPYKRYDYTYWSSPVFSANIGTTFPLWRTDYSFSFNTANFSDVTGPDGTGPADAFDDNNDAWTSAPPATNMVRAKGYAIMAPSVGTFPTTNTVTFTGTVNNGVVSIPVVLSANAANNNDDFNLIGNPYPSAVDGNSFITANPLLSGTLYFWTHKTEISATAPGPGSSNYVVDDYAMYNLSGGTASVSGSPPPTGKIASAQGFFVEAVSAGNVSFNNTMRSKSYDNSDFFRATTLERDRIWLNFDNDYGMFSQLLVGYFDEATNDVDWGYDGVIHPTASVTSFYSLLGEDFYRIQGRAPFIATDIVPLGYKSIAGEFSISIANIEGQLANQNTNVYLEDTTTGIFHNLKQGPFIFTTNAGIFNDRFILRYTTESLGGPDFGVSSRLQIAVSNQRIYFKSSDTINNVQLYDMLGRKVYSAHVGTVDFSTPAIAANGVLIAKVIFSDGTTAERKIRL